MTENLRELFHLQEGLVFLNHGSFGACPKPVFKTYQDWQLTLENQPVAFLDQERGLLDNMKAARVAVAKELGANEQDIVGVENATAGLNAIARSQELTPGDEILTSNHEYNALENTWRFVADRTGAKIVVADIAIPLRSEDQFTSSILKKMTENTKVLFLSHITSPTSLVFPIENVVKEARNRGIITVIDGAHAPGLIHLNLNELNADFYSGNCHKWMMAPKGSAFLWAHKDVQHTLEPTVISHGWVPQNGNKEQLGAFGDSRFIDCFEVQGTRDPAAWFTVPAAIEFKQLHNWEKVKRRSSELAMATAVTISKLTKIPLFASHEFLAPQLVSIPLPDCDVDELKNRLLSEYDIEIPVFRWADICIVRLSIQGYNTQQEADALVNAISEILGLR